MTREEHIKWAQWTLEKKRIQDYGFPSFCNAFGYQLAPHHKLMAAKLERAIHEPGYNLIICMPPGHAKSRYASVLFPTYYLGRYPGKSVIMITHTQDFSDRWGRFSKRIISTPKYQFLFNAHLNKDSHAASRFDLSNGSEYFGSGILGNITGNRVDIMIMDDLLKGKQDADSETIRDKIWDAYIWDARTRIKPGASKIMIATRWHEDDPIGRILISNDRSNWDIINFPALIETQSDKDNDVFGRDFGEALWPEYITKEMLVAERDSLDKKDIRMWHSLYQQKPSNEDGSYFKKEYFQRINKLPSDLEFYGGSDYAVTDGDGDYTVHVVFGYDSKHDDLYIAHVWRKQVEPHIWVEEFINIAHLWKTHIWAEENGQIIKSIGPHIDNTLNNRNKYIYRKQFNSTSKKTVRARSLQARMALGKVYILNAPWTDEFIKEFLSFPTGTHDDQVDACSIVMRMLEEMVIKLVKPHKKEEYEYKSGTIMLPGLDEIVSLKKVGEFKRI